MSLYLPKKSHDVDGILNKKGILVKCSSSPLVQPSGYSCEESLNSGESYFCSDRTLENPWVTYSFPKHYISISNYSLTFPKVEHHKPKSYKFEGRIGTDWILLDDLSDISPYVSDFVITRPVFLSSVFSKN